MEEPIVGAPVRIKKEKKKVEAKETFFGNFPPLSLPFNKEIEDVWMENKPRSATSIRELERAELVKERELIRSSGPNIVKDELVFIQLPSKLPFDTDEMRKEILQDQYDKIEESMRDVKYDPEWEFDAKQEYITEPRNKLNGILKEKEKVGKPKEEERGKNVWTEEFKNDLEDLNGFIGKMMVCKSGKVKMRIGEVWFDVSPGVNVSFEEKVAVINELTQEMNILGNINKHLVITPDFINI
jgi:hypothetical protein